MEATVRQGQAAVMVVVTADIMAEATTEDITAVTMDIMEDITAVTIIIMEGTEDGERDWVWEYWGALAWAIMEAVPDIIVPLLMDTDMEGTEDMERMDMATLPHR